MFYYHKNLTNLYAFQANILYEEALSIKESSENAVELSLIKNLRLKNENILPQELLEDEKIKDFFEIIDLSFTSVFSNNWGVGLKFLNNSYNKTIQIFSFYIYQFYTKKVKSLESTQKHFNESKSISAVSLY